MNFNEQHKKKLAILQQLKNKQELEKQRARQKEFGLDDLVTKAEQFNNISKNASNIGKGLSKSNNAVVSNVGDKLKIAGDFGQKLTGEGVKQQIGNALKSKLGLGAKAGTQAATQAATQAGTTAATTGATTAGTAAGTTGALGTTAGSALGAGTAAGTTAGTAGALGTTAATTAGGALGTTAATTAGGTALGTLGPALGALGPVGAALAAGYMIYSMVNSAKKKKAAKQMQVSAQAAQDTMEQSNAKKAEAMQNLQSISAQPQQVPSYIPEAENTTTDAIEPVIEQPTEETSPLDILTQATSSGEEALDPDAVIDTEGADLGELAGAAAAPVNPEDTKSSIIDSLKSKLSNTGETVQTGLNKLASGLNDFNAGYQDNARTSFTEGDLYNRLMSGNNEQTGTTQTEDGAFELSANEKQKKNIMNMLGEAAGTAHRIAAHPLTQGAIAGLAYGKSENDPLYGLGKGVEYAQGKAKSDYYQNKVNPNSLPSIFGGYTEKDYNADTLSKYRETTAENNKMKAELARDKQRFDEMYKNEQIAMEKEYNNARIEDMKNKRNLDSEKWNYEKEQDAEAKRQKEIDKGLADGTLIRVVSPDGTTGVISATKWKEAKAMGAKRI